MKSYFYNNKKIFFNKKNLLWLSALTIVWIEDEWGRTDLFLKCPLCTALCCNTYRMCLTQRRPSGADQPQPDVACWIFSTNTRDSGCMPDCWRYSWSDRRMDRCLHGWLFDAYYEANFRWASNRRHIWQDPPCVAHLLGTKSLHSHCLFWFSSARRLICRPVIFDWVLCWWVYTHE